MSDDSYINHENWYFGFCYNSGFITEAKIVSLFSIFIALFYPFALSFGLCK